MGMLALALLAATGCLQLGAAAAAARGVPLPPSHNGGVREVLVAPAAATKPHVLFVLWDDYGWAGAGYHRPDRTPEIQTPSMDALVAGGIASPRRFSHFRAPLYIYHRESLRNIIKGCA
jgi:hypothetical protein